MRKSALSMLCVMAVASVNAAVHLPSFFSDQMVLQREKPIPIFGTATPGEHIQVTFLGDTIKGIADEKGDWKVELPEAKAGGPFELMVEGENKIQLKDIWVGEVWLASGQSNMEWPLEYTEQAAEEIDAAHYPQIRQYKVPRLIEHSEQKDLQGQWDVCSPDTAGSFSGVGYYFAKELHQELDVPVGIIFTAYGGTDVEAWMPLDTLKEVPFMTKRIEDYKTWEASRSTGSPFREEMKTVKGWLKGVTRVVDPGNRNFFLGWAETDYDDSSWEKMALPTEWEPQGLAIDGIVWFRKHVSIPAEWDGKDLVLELGSIDDFDTTYINGVQVGATGKESIEPHRAKRSYTIPASVIDAGQTNVISVRVFDHFGGGGFGGRAEEMKLFPVSSTSEALTLSGDWLYKVAVAMSDLSIHPESRTSQLASSPNNPAVLYNGMIHPFIPYAMRGVIWYQGENNSGRYDEYPALFPRMISSWRARWDQGDFPFFFVQIANYKQRQTEPCEEQSIWAGIRHAQNSALTLTNTAVAVITDVGDADDIHPRDKKTVGHRLALLARAQVYGESIDHESPSFDKMEQKDGRIVLSFKHTYGSLKTSDSDTVRGFSIQDAAGAWHWASATIQGDTIILHTEGINAPKSVRYNWASNPIGNVINAAELPMGLFQSDVSKRE